MPGVLKSGACGAAGPASAASLGRAARRTPGHTRSLGLPDQCGSQVTQTGVRPAALPRSRCSGQRSLRQWPRLLAAADSGPGAHHRDGCGDAKYLVCAHEIQEGRTVRLPQVHEAATGQRPQVRRDLVARPANGRIFGSPCRDAETSTVKLEGWPSCTRVASDSALANKRRIANPRVATAIAARPRTHRARFFSPILTSRKSCGRLELPRSARECGIGTHSISEWLRTLVSPR